jgi:hypothetical protein
VVGLVDNFVKPYLIRAGMEIRGAVVFFALIGGLSAFGPIGLLMGPLLVALFLALVRMYQRDYNRSNLGALVETRIRCFTAVVAARDRAHVIYGGQMESTMRNGDGRELQQHAAGRSSYWDPFGILTGIAAWWDPLGVFRPLTLPTRSFPRSTARDTGDAYVLEADLPGIQESELEMSVTGNRLSVSGKRECGQQEKDGQVLLLGASVRHLRSHLHAAGRRGARSSERGVPRRRAAGRDPEAPGGADTRIALTGARSGGNPAAASRRRAAAGGASRPASDAEQPPEPTTPSRTKRSPARRLARTRPGRQAKQAHSGRRNLRPSASR